jgi:hypothetical protein
MEIILSFPDMIWTIIDLTMDLNSSWPSMGAAIISKKAIGSGSRSSGSKLPRSGPHGLSYSFTLHAPDGTRLVGFDNAHGVPATGLLFKRRPQANDHWHRTENDPGRPYQFKDAETLIDDFFDEVERVLSERGIETTVVDVEDTRRSK